MRGGVARKRRPAAAAFGRTGPEGRFAQAIVSLAQPLGLLAGARPGAGAVLSRLFVRTPRRSLPARAFAPAGSRPAARRGPAGPSRTAARAPLPAGGDPHRLHLPAAPPVGAAILADQHPSVSHLQLCPRPKKAWVRRRGQLLLAWVARPVLLCPRLRVRPLRDPLAGAAAASRRGCVAKKLWSSTAPPEEFHPYVESSALLPEFSLRAVIFGAFFGIVFGAVTVYVGLRAGLTVSASIPIAVLSISILRAFGKASILENNIVQTTGSAGESVAAGVIFTLPALIFLGFSLNTEYWRVFSLALIGGWLGVLFMIPLRRQLIVKEHGNLLYPEGTACADVLVAGERGGSFAGRVFWGLGLGGLYTILMNIVQAWPDQPEYQPKWLPGASFRAAVTSEYLGVGYIIGPRVAGTIFAGGVFSWLVMMPAIRFFGSLAPGAALYPSTVPIPQMTPDQLWASYIRPMGAGAVAAAGLITLLKTMPTIFAALGSGLKDVRAQRAGEVAATSRIERDLSMRVVLLGSLVIVALMWALLTFKPIPGAETTRAANLAAGLFVVVFGFLFVTVSSRICGLIGTSANPVSGMTIATLMATCAMFLVAGWTGGAYAVLALTIGGVVAIASANAGATSQDLKTGYLVGATPVRQQIGLVIGVLAASFAIGGTLLLMNKGLEKYTPVQIPLRIEQLPTGVQVESSSYAHKGRTYILVNALGSREVPDGKYLYDSVTRQIEIQWVQGIGSDKAAAPQE